MSAGERFLRRSEVSDGSHERFTQPVHKVWDLHTVGTLPSGQTQLFIGLHLIHEVTSPQAFEMLRIASCR